MNRKSRGIKPEQKEAITDRDTMAGREAEATIITDAQFGFQDWRSFVMVCATFL